MRVLVVCLLLGMAFAGCFQSEKAETREPETPEPQPPAPTGKVHGGAANQNGSTNAPAVAENPEDSPFGLTTAWLSVADMDGREPTVAVDSNGYLFYAARDYSGGSTPPVSATQTPIMLSTDGGYNWTDVSPLLPTGDREPPRSGDPMVVADPWTDRIFQIELYDLVCNWLVYTDNQGADWTSNPKACSSLVVDHQTITSGPSSTGVDLVPYPNVVYVCVNQIADSHCSRSLDGGLTFSSFHLVFPGVDTNGNLCGGIHGHAIVGPNGAVYLPRAYCGNAAVGVSTNDGLTWGLYNVDQGLGSSSNDPNMAFDGAGNMYYMWTTADHRVFLTWTNDNGITWSKPVQASDPEATYANHPSITAGSDGRIGFVYLATYGDPDEPWENLTWDAYMGASYDATSEDPTFVTVKANPDGDVVYRGNCLNIRCGYIREFLDASIAPDGTFYGAFVDACLREDEPRVRNAVDCNTEVAPMGEGNGHLAYVGHARGIDLYVGDRVVSGSG